MSGNQGGLGSENSELWRPGIDQILNKNCLH